MAASALSQDLSLLGGPLHRLGCRLGLVRNGTNTVALGVAIGLLLWSVLIGLALIGGVAGHLFSFSLVGGHVRLLLVIPLLFVCEAVFDPRVAEFVRFLVRWQIVPEQQAPVLDSVIGRVSRWQASWIPEAACLIAAVLISLGAARLDLGGSTSGLKAGQVAANGAVAWWYSVVCLTVFRFLVFRWAWRLLLWTWFLWRVSRLQLRLLPTHPDDAGGLGYLEIVHTQFVPLVVSISALRAATLAEELVGGTAQFDAIIPQAVIIVLASATLFLGPLLVFVPKLWECRLRGLRNYMGLAEHYVGQFDSKWLGASAPAEPLLGSADIQSLADLSNSVNIVRNMHWIPISSRLLLSIAGAALLPMFTLMLLKYPIAELTRKLFTGLVGL